MSDYDNGLNLIRQAQREERYEEAHELLIEYLESASNLRDGERLANGLLAFAENLLYCCPESDDPFEGRKEAAQAALGIFEELGDKRGITNALLILASVDMRFDGRLEREALAVARSIGYVEGAADATRQLGILAHLSGDLEAARNLASEAVSLARTTGDEELLFQTLFFLSVVLSGHERRAACEEAVELARKLQSERRFATLLLTMASLLSDDFLDLKERWVSEAMEISQGVEDRALDSGVLYQLSLIASARGDEARAAELKAKSEAISGPMPDISDFTKAMEERDLTKGMEACRAILAKLREQG